MAFLSLIRCVCPVCTGAASAKILRTGERSAKSRTRPKTRPVTVGIVAAIAAIPSGQQPRFGASSSRARGSIGSSARSAHLWRMCS